MRISLLPGMLAVVVVVGCVSHAPRPLDPEDEWRRLEAFHLENLTVSRASDPADQGQLPVFDYTDGLSSDEAAGLAVALNPALRGARLNEGIAEAQLLGAGILPNPSLDTKWLVPTNAASWKGEVNGAIDLTQILLRRPLEIERAEIQVEQVRWDLANREWVVAAQARQAWVDVVFAEESLRLFDLVRLLLERLVELTRDQQKAGAAGTLELLLAESDLASQVRLGPRLRGERQRALQALNALMGLPPNHATRLQEPGKALVFVPMELAPTAAAEKLWARRPDLLALQQAYAGAEKELQIACRKQFPALKLGPSWEREGTTNSLGFNATLELPIWNRNQGEIGVKLALRDQRHREYQAALQAARSDFEGSWAQLQALDGELKLTFAELVPRLERSVELTQRVLQAGSVSQSEVLKLELRLLETRTELLKTLRDFHRARVDLDRAMGPQLPLTPS